MRLRHEHYQLTVRLRRQKSTVVFLGRGDARGAPVRYKQPRRDRGRYIFYGKPATLSDARRRIASRCCSRRRVPYWLFSRSYFVPTNELTFSPTLAVRHRTTDEAAGRARTECLIALRNRACARARVHRRTAVCVCERYGDDDRVLVVVRVHVSPRSALALRVRVRPSLALANQSSSRSSARPPALHRAVRSYVSAAGGRGSRATAVNARRHHTSDLGGIYRVLLRGGRR